MTESVVLGLDLGTSRVKVAAVDQRGVVRALAHRDVGLVQPGPGRVEQEPDELLAAMTGAVREAVGQLGADGARLVGLACSTAMHSLLALDEAGRPLTRSITWADTRAVREVRELAELPGRRELARRTGTPLSTMTPLSKLRWFAAHEPALARRARWVSGKELLLLHLTGERVVDHSMASATGLFDLERRDWDAEALELARVRREQLSVPVSTTAVAGRLRPTVAAALGLPAGLPVVAGAADGCLENLGAGAVDEGSAAVTIGTSGAVRTIVREPQGDPEGRLFCYALTDDRWVVGGPISNGGLVPRWALQRLFPELARQAEAEGRSAYALVDELAGSVPAGAAGLVCLPALVGERAPTWNPDLRGALVGLDAAHGREHVLRALLEGVAYQVALVFEALERAHPIEAVRATGGFTESEGWVEILAGVLDRTLGVPRENEGASFGAALLGLEALGLGKAFELALAITAEPGRVVRPRHEDLDAYRRTFAVFRGLEPALTASFTALASLRA